MKEDRNTAEGMVQFRREMVLVSIVTAPFWAKTLPVTFAPLFKVMLVNATMFPANPVRCRLAELPTCQNRLQLGSPLIKTTGTEPEAVVSVLPILNTNTASMSPWRSRVSSPCQLSRRVETIDARREGKSTEILTS